MIYTIYDPTSGAIMSSGVADAKNIGSGVAYVPGRYNAEDYYINLATREAVRYPARPSANSWVSYTWNYDDLSWSVNTKVSSQNVKRLRDEKLLAVDRINPIWWASMTPVQQAEATTYRQALLDVTDQPGYPVDITWPVKPAWL